LLCPVFRGQVTPASSRQRQRAYGQVAGGDLHGRGGLYDLLVDWDHENYHGGHRRRDRDILKADGSVPTIVTPLINTAPNANRTDDATTAREVHSGQCLDTLITGVACPFLHLEWARRTLQSGRFWWNEIDFDISREL
jgi:hypothetical protein